MGKTTKTDKILHFRLQIFENRRNFSKIFENFSKIFEIHSELQRDLHIRTVPQSEHFASPFWYCSDYGDFTVLQFFGKILKIRKLLPKKPKIYRKLSNFLDLLNKIQKEIPRKFPHFSTLRKASFVAEIEKKDKMNKQKTENKKKSRIKKNSFFRWIFANFPKRKFYSLQMM